MNEWVYENKWLFNSTVKGNHNIRVGEKHQKFYGAYLAHHKSFIFTAILLGNCYEQGHALAMETEAVTG